MTIYSTGTDYNPNQDGGWGEPPDDGILWTCPHCGSENIDHPSMTAIPMCGDCQKDVDWQEIIDSASDDGAGRAGDG